MHCYNCGSSEYVKNGHHHGVQRYKCKECGYQFTEIRSRQDKSDITKALAVTLYLIGLPYKKVASLVKECSRQEIILNWVKEQGFKVRKTDPEISREQWHKRRVSFDTYMAKEGYRIKRNRAETDELKKKFSVPLSYSTPCNTYRGFVGELDDIIKYMVHPKEKSKKRFVVLEINRDSGDVEKMMLTP